MNYLTSPHKPTPVTLLRIACFTIFLGRAWQHLFWDVPFRALLWDEQWFSSWTEALFSITWKEYATSPKADNIIQTIIHGFGWFYVLMAAITLVINNKTRMLRWLLLFSSLPLIFLAFLYCKEKFFHAGQFFEYTIQFMCPILLYYAIFKKENFSTLILSMKISITLTFTCHGLYALGYYPRPGNFVDMTLNILPFSEDMAHLFLKTMGIVDFIIALGIFIPFITKPLLIWATIWGISTALARVFANFYIDFWFDTLNQWLPHALYRLSHGLIPLALLVTHQQYFKFKPKAIRQEVEMA